MREKYQISFSGGRTSAYMTKMLLDHYSDKYEFIVTFANTGMEHEKTLEFINNCDKYFGFNTIWLEADVKHGERKSTGFKVVNFETASRNGEPFHEVVKKYGVPNQSYPHCTRELKLNVMRSYLKSIGIKHTEIKTAIGIRMDELRRVSETAEKLMIEYPLIKDFPSDKEDILDWWSEQDFDLEIDEWDGNCKGCFKKSFKKLFKQLDSDPSLLEFHISMENMYPQIGNKKPYYQDVYDMNDSDVADAYARYDFDPINNPKPDPKIISRSLIKQPDRVFFRGQTPAKELLKLWKENRNSENPDFYVQSGGCSESCEVYSCD